MWFSDANGIENGSTDLEAVIRSWIRLREQGLRLSRARPGRDVGPRPDWPAPTGMDLQVEVG